MLSVSSAGTSRHPLVVDGDDPNLSRSGGIYALLCGRTGLLRSCDGLVSRSCVNIVVHRPLQVRGAMVFPNPYPFAYARFLGLHGDLTSREFECRRFARGIPGSPFGCSQSMNALPSGSRNIACFPLGVSVGGNSKATPLKRSSSWTISMSSVESTMTRYMPGSMKDDQVTNISEVAEFFGATSDQRMPSLQVLSTRSSKPNVPP